MLGRSPLMRHARNRMLFPGLNLDPGATHSIAGKLSYGRGVNFGEGCNLIVPTGAVLQVGDDCYIGRHVELGPLGTIEIGSRTSIQDRSVLLGDIVLGRYCVVAYNAYISSGNHSFRHAPHFLIRDQDREVSANRDSSSDYSRPIIVGEDCWLGVNTVIMPGITIGRGCVVGANAVVTHDLPPYSIAAGSPARVINQRLKFAPPVSLNWQDPLHIPYFYCGFEIADDERLKNRALEGHVAQGRFAVWLAGGSELHVRARSIGSDGCVVTCNGQQMRLSTEWDEYLFPIRGNEGPVWFDADRPLAVREAWIA
ncbi:MAG: acyltransferase [Pseudolabrys sp.]